MIPSIETIVEGLVDDTYTKSEAVNWLHEYAETAFRDLRDEYAMAALTGLLAAHRYTERSPEEVAKHALKIADACMEKRGE